MDSIDRVRDNAILKVDLSQASSGSVEKMNRMGAAFGKRRYIRVCFYIAAQIGLAEVSFKARKSRLKMSYPSSFKTTGSK